MSFEYFKIASFPRQHTLLSYAPPSERFSTDINVRAENAFYFMTEIIRIDFYRFFFSSFCFVYFFILFEISVYMNVTFWKLQSILFFLLILSLNNNGKWKLEILTHHPDSDPASNATKHRHCLTFIRREFVAFSDKETDNSVDVQISWEVTV